MFIEYPKTPRLRREVVITEKIDGTNSAITVREIPGNQSPVFYANPDDGPDTKVGYIYGKSYGGLKEGVAYAVFAQSRSRLITPKDDNFGFAKWVHEHMRELAETLGTGTHFGEWWGSGIQRNYGLPKGEKRFSLFNLKRWSFLNGEQIPGVYAVPEITRGILSTELIDEALETLTSKGSFAAPGFMRPEGIIVYHTAANSSFKVLLEGDELPKSVSEAA